MGHRRGSDPMLLWLWHRPVATAPIRPLAWEPPYAEGVALEKAKRQKKKKKKREWAGRMKNRCGESSKEAVCEVQSRDDGDWTQVV